jgi:signal transduction histidine kinase
MAKKRNITIKTQLAQNLHTQAHFCLLFQVVVNLLVNAIEALAGSKSANYIFNSAKTILIKLEKQQNQAVIIIQDNGPGIDGSCYCGLKPELNPSGNCHLGLYLARTIIKTELQGKMEIMSQPHQGTTVKIKIPTVPASTQINSTAQSNESPYL